MAALFQRRHSSLEHQTYSLLTEQERIVLLHMSYAKTKDEIVQALSISPRTVEKHRQNIYQKLDVHSEWEALLVAYQQALFSPLEAIE